MSAVSNRLGVCRRASGLLVRRVQSGSSTSSSSSCSNQISSASGATVTTIAGNRWSKRRFQDQMHAADQSASQSSARPSSSMSNSDWKKFQEDYKMSSATTNAFDSSQTAHLDPKLARKLEVNRSWNGMVRELVDTVAHIEGFTAARPGHMVQFHNGAKGLVLSVSQRGCSIGMLSRNDQSNPGSMLSGGGGSPAVSKGEFITAEDNFFCTPPSTIVGPCTVGKAVDVFGQPLSWIAGQESMDYSTDIEESEKKYGEGKHTLFRNFTLPNSKFTTPWKSHEKPANRKVILTGLKAFDTFHPLCRGWRQAYIGHESVDCITDIGLDIALSFKSFDNKSSDPSKYTRVIFAMIDKPRSEIQRVYDALKRSGALNYTTLVASVYGEDLATNHHLCAYSAATMADFWKFSSMHSIVIYDCMTAHNNATQQLMDASRGMFGTYGNWHAELLERSTQLTPEFGGGSSTAICLARKTGDMSGANSRYLTCLSSHCDDIINLSTDAFLAGVSPPISLFPVPFTSPKYIKVGTWLHTLSAAVRQRLQFYHESEKAIRQQREIGLDIEPDLALVMTAVSKLTQIFHQKYETDLRMLIVLLSSLKYLMHERIHVSKANLYEARLYEWFMNAHKYDGMELEQKVWKDLKQLTVESKFDEKLESELCDCFERFLHGNVDLLRPPNIEGDSDDDW